MWNDLCGFTSVLKPQLCSKSMPANEKSQSFCMKKVAGDWVQHTSSIWDICFLLSMQCSLHQLSGDGVPDRPPGCCQGHNWDTGCCFSTYCHRCALQGVLTGHHTDWQPEEVSLNLRRLGKCKIVMWEMQRSCLHVKTFQGICFWR